MISDPVLTTTEPAAVSRTTATTARRVIADRRASENTALVSWIAPRAAARSLALRNRGSARLDSKARSTSTTHISMTVVPVGAAGVERSPGMSQRCRADGRRRHQIPAVWRVSTQLSSCIVVPEDYDHMLRRILTGLTLVFASGCTNPRVQANIAQALNDVGNELTAQRQDMALLQDQVDSLKRAMAHQDSTIKRLINVTGIPAGAP
jgi:hypothetical protein